jgi:hypothetical protein
MVLYSWLTCVLLLCLHACALYQASMLGTMSPDLILCRTPIARGIWGALQLTASLPITMQPQVYGRLSVVCEVEVYD